MLFCCKINPMKKLLWSLLFLILAALQTAYAVEEKTTIKVGISSSNFSTYEHSNITIVIPPLSSVTDMSGNFRKSYDTNAEITIKIENSNFAILEDNKPVAENIKGPITIASSDTIGIKGVNRKGNPARYRGIIEITSTKPNKFNIINVLDMQSYLKGVVPNEMPISFGIEALKAQAVAARNYANRPITAYKNYDVCDSTACQVYYGANSETEISNKAVDKTLGIYALYNNEIILALYSSTASGITENYFDTFGNFMEDKPYLKSVADTNELLRINDEDYFKKSYPSFDMKSPKYRWERTYTKEELENVLSKTLQEQSKAGAVEPKFNQDDTIKNLKDIKVLKRGASRKVLELEILTDKENYIVKKELPIRRTLKQNGVILPSANFIIEKEYKKSHEESKENMEQDKNKEIIFENNEEVASDENHKKFHIKEKLLHKAPSTYTFYGAGFGHGVGMSQFGAGYLSHYGIPYQNILKHYYTGISLGTIPKKVSYNLYGINYAQEFYFTKNNKTKHVEHISKSPLKKELAALSDKNKSKKCYLIIENEDKVSNIEFFINGYYFNPETKGFKKKVLKTDITNYLEEGYNKIIFNPLKETDKRKTLSFYIIFGEEND